AWWASSMRPVSSAGCRREWERDAMTQAPVPAMPVQPRRAGPGLAISLTVMGVGRVLAIISVILIVLPLISSLTSPEFPVPGRFDVHLHHARYTVYQRTG